MRITSCIRSKVVGLAMAAVLAASPLMMVSMSMVAGCGGGKVCFPDLCGCNSFFAAGLLAIWLVRGGDAGVNGISCWDLNGNAVCDLATEDANQDGACSILDCKGPDGESGLPIPPLDGIQCWDLNANATCDLATEDTNQDGVCNALDCRGPAGPPGQDGTDGQDGNDGQPADQHFDWFVEDFYTYGPISDNVSGQGEVLTIQEPILEYVAGAQPVRVGFRTSVPEIYHEGNPVTLRLFLWRECDLSRGRCESLTLDIFRAIPGNDISRYGQKLWLRLDISGIQTEPGMLVVDLPLNTPEPYGLGFDNDLYAKQVLAFEVNTYVVDACYTVLGAEVFESLNVADTAISKADVFHSAADLAHACGTCNVDVPVQGGCDDGDSQTVDVCQPSAVEDTNWGSCLNISLQPAP
jgi:hypothetical protein